MPFELQEVETPRISRHSAHEGGKVVNPTNLPPLLQSYSAAAKIKSMKNFNNSIDYRTRNLSACSAVPPHNPIKQTFGKYLFSFILFISFKH